MLLLSNIYVVVSTHCKQIITFSFFFVFYILSHFHPFFLHAAIVPLRLVVYLLRMVLLRVVLLVLGTLWLRVRVRVRVTMCMLVLVLVLLREMVLLLLLLLLPLLPLHLLVKQGLLLVVVHQARLRLHLLLH